MCAQRKRAGNCLEVAGRVLIRYPKKSLLAADAKYDFEFAASPEDWRTWTNFHSRGYMTLPELKRLSRWKAGGRQQANIASNSGKAVEAVTRAAVQVNSEIPDEPALAIGILTTLDGVDIPTASAIMTALEPQRFGILDIRVWKALRKAAPDDFQPLQSKEGNRRPFRLYEVDQYLCVIREVAAQNEVSCRQIDRALWVLGEAR